MTVRKNGFQNWPRNDDLTSTRPRENGVRFLSRRKRSKQPGCLSNPSASVLIQICLPGEVHPTHLEKGGLKTPQANSRRDLDFHAGHAYPFGGARTNSHDSDGTWSKTPG